MNEQPPKLSRGEKILSGIAELKERLWQVEREIVAIEGDLRRATPMDGIPSTMSLESKASLERTLSQHQDTKKHLEDGIESLENKLNQ